MNQLLDLFLTFARIGGLTFGGGYAMLPILQREVVEKRHWATEEELMDYYAIGQCTPGIIAVNTGDLCRTGTCRLHWRYRRDSGRCIPVPDHYHGHRGIYPELCASRDRTERLCGYPCLRLCPDLQRGGQTLEKGSCG